MSLVPLVLAYSSKVGISSCLNEIVGARLSVTCLNKCNLNYHPDCNLVPEVCCPVCIGELKRVRLYHSTKDYDELYRRRVVMEVESKIQGWIDSRSEDEDVSKYEMTDDKSLQKVKLQMRRLNKRDKDAAKLSKIIDMK